MAVRKVYVQCLTLRVSGEETCRRIAPPPPQFSVPSMERHAFPLSVYAPVLVVVCTRNFTESLLGISLWL